MPVLGGRDGDDSRMIDKGEQLREDGPLVQGCLVRSWPGHIFWTQESQALKSSHLATLWYCWLLCFGSGQVFITQVTSLRNCMQTSGYVMKKL